MLVFAPGYAALLVLLLLFLELMGGYDMGNFYDDTICIIRRSTDLRLRSQNAMQVELAYN